MGQFGSTAGKCVCFGSDNRVCTSFFVHNCYHQRLYSVKKKKTSIQKEHFAFIEIDS